MEIEGTSKGKKVGSSSEDGVDSRIEELLSENFVGKQFDSVEEVESFYKQYSTWKGFGYRKSSTRYNKNEILVSRVFVCSNEGYRKEKEDNRKREPVSISRTGCKAMLRTIYKKSSCKWEVKAFEKEHNHPLTQVNLVRSNCQVEEAYISLATALHSSGVHTSQIYNFMRMQAGGAQNLHFSRKDLYNSPESYRRDYISYGDLEACLIYLKLKADSDPGFFYKYTTDEDNRLQNLFWSDSYSRSDYACFGDVLAFDTTYRHNAYDLPLLVFVGVNHHLQSIVYAFALLTDETTDTFIWGLETFLDCMLQRSPTSVVTNGDRAMQVAIERMFPSARHRLCSWHIMHNAKSNLQDSECVADFRTCMRSFWRIDQFEVNWHRMVEHYGVQDNPWIIQKYNTKQYWAQAYLTGYFFGSFKTTSRCEWINSYLSKFVTKKQTLLEFVRAMDEALKDIRDDELGYDYVTRHKHPYLSHPMKEVEAHAASIYTRRVFNRFRTYLQFETLYRVLERKRLDEHTHAYILCKYKQPEHTITVTCNKLTEVISCSCKRYESEGLPCSHSIHIMKVEDMIRIPDSLICHRFTANAKYDAPIRIVEHSDPEFIGKVRFASLNSDCQRLCHLGTKTAEIFSEGRIGIARLIARMEDLLAQHSKEDDAPKDVKISDPRKRKSREKDLTKQGRGGGEDIMDCDNDVPLSDEDLRWNNVNQSSSTTRDRWLQSDANSISLQESMFEDGFSQSVDMNSRDRSLTFNNEWEPID